MGNTSVNTQEKGPAIEPRTTSNVKPNTDSKSGNNLTNVTKEAEKETSANDATKVTPVSVPKGKNLPNGCASRKWQDVYLQLEDWGLSPSTLRVADTEPCFVISPGAYATWKSTYGPYDLEVCMQEVWENGRESDYLIGMGGHGVQSWMFAAIRREARALVGFQVPYGGMYNNRDEEKSNVNGGLATMDQISRCLSDPSIQAAIPKGKVLVAILSEGKGMNYPQYALAEPSVEWQHIAWSHGRLDPSNLMSQLSDLY